jgi:hypothetical protein
VELLCPRTSSTTFSLVSLSSSRGLAFHSSALRGLGAAHAVVAEAVTITQTQVREPRPCLQPHPAFSFGCKVVPHTVLVELDLGHVAVGVGAEGHHEGACLGGKVGAEVVAMVVLLPVQAEIREDVRRAIAQVHGGSAVARLTVPRRVEISSRKSNVRILPLFINLHRPHIPDWVGLRECLKQA